MAEWFHACYVGLCQWSDTLRIKFINDFISDDRWRYPLEWIGRHIKGHPSR